MNAALDELKSELRAIHDLEAAASVLAWDQQTYMPEGGANARARQMALLGRLAHERRSAPRMGELFAALGKISEQDSLDGALVRRARWSYEQAVRVPSELVSEHRELLGASYSAWTKAKPQGDFATMRPYLEKNIELSRRIAECFGASDHIADPLIDAQDKGMSASSVRALFQELRAELVPMVRTIVEMPPPDDSFLQREFAPDAQLAFGAEVAGALGYDFQRGRQDLTHHPFMVRLAGGDIRITTRVVKNDPTRSLFGTIHETGHALYEQNIDEALDASPLGQGTSTGVHESQSRLWENLVGRSRAFWSHWFPKLQARFTASLGDVDLDEFHRAINKVERGLIRVAADEVTYNLHVMLRFELELQMLEALSAAELPEAWNARIASDLGMRPPSDAEGCLQDVHWYVDNIGGHFQGYTIGNIMSAQFYEAASAAVPDLEAQIATGNVTSLRRWLTDNLYRHGARFDPAELVQRATGKPLSTGPVVAYLKRKYGALYGVSL